MNKKLNMGCNRKKLNGYLNADINNNTNPDMVVPPLPQRQPFKDKEFDEVLFDNCMQYVPVIDIVPSLKEMCRIGKKVIVSFSPKNMVGSTIFERGINMIGYSILSFYYLDEENRKSKSWRDWDYDFKINKIWFELNFRRFWHVRLLEWWVNKSKRNQQLYENSCLFYLFPARWIWIEFKGV
ncbi:MAG: hypothetical protein ABIH25_01665 [Candidatus Woesearchaeota archaeon]